MPTCAVWGPSRSPTGRACSSGSRALAPDGVDAAIDTVGTDEAIDVSVALVADRAGSSPSPASSAVSSSASR